MLERIRLKIDKVLWYTADAIGALSLVAQYLWDCRPRPIKGLVFWTSKTFRFGGKKRRKKAR